jgi:hypothetical protein
MSPSTLNVAITRTGSPDCARAGMEPGAISPTTTNIAASAVPKLRRCTIDPFPIHEAIRR